MTEFRERAVRFGPGGSLAGVLTVPLHAGAVAVPAVVILTAGVIHRVGPNRMHVRLARELARRGHLVLRFDLSGVGESDARADEPELERAIDRDIGDALSFLELECAVTSVVFFGMCSGANNALRYAATDTRVLGLAITDPAAFRTPWFYVVHYAQSLTRLESWLNIITGRHPLIRRVLRRWRNVPPPAPTFSAAFPNPTREQVDASLTVLATREVDTLMVFTGGVKEQYNYGAQFRDTFPHHARSGRVAVHFVPGADHTFSSELSKATLLTLVTEWLPRFRGRVRAPRHSPAGIVAQYG